MPQLPERVFLKLAKLWSQKHSARPDVKNPPNEELELAFAAVVVAHEYGNTFAENAVQQIQENISLSPLDSDVRLIWLIAGCSKEVSPGLLYDSPLKTLQNNLAHPEYLTHIRLLKLAWLIRPWLNRDETIPILLKSVKESGYPSFLMAWGLAAEISSLKDLHERAEAFSCGDDDAKRAFSVRLNKIKSFHGIGFLEEFWKTESSCRRLITDQALSLGLT